MALSVNRISECGKISSLKKQNSTQRQSKVSFQGAPMSKTLKNTAVGFALFAASVLGISACSNKSNESDKSDTRYEYMKNPYYTSENRDYDKYIDYFMLQDDRVTNVEVSEGINPEYTGAYRRIISEGYDYEGNLVRKIVVHPKEPSISFALPVYCPEYEYKETRIEPDKIVTEYHDSERPSFKIVEHKGIYSLDGESGFRKKEIFYDMDAKEPEIFRKEIYTKGEILSVKNGSKIYSPDSHIKEIYYSSRGKVIGWFNYYADNDGILRYDKEGSKSYKNPE